MISKKATRGHSDGTPAPRRDKTSSKRAKSSQACESCRKHKTRCELLEYNPIPGSPLKCHRCKVLDIQCSFENSDVIRVIQRPSPPGDVTSSVSTSSLESVYNPRAEFPLPVSALHNQSVSAGILAGDGLNQMEAQNVMSSPSSRWNSVSNQGGFDWATTPVVAIQELMKLAPMHPIPVPILAPHEHIGTILSQDQVISLLDIFDSHYAPWLGLQPHRWERSSPQHDLVRCTVACRHLDPVTRNRVLPRLQKLAEETSIEHIFNPTPSYDFIESIIILAAWSPVGAPSSSEARDPRLLIASAVNMAIKLKISEDFARTRTKARKHEMDEEDYRARLWLILEMGEANLCLGTGRPPLSRRVDSGIASETDIDTSCLSSREGSIGLRIEICAKIGGLAQAGTHLRLDPDTLPNFYLKSTEVLAKLESLRRNIEPLPVISTFTSFHFQMCLVNYHAARLLVLHHIIQEIRRVYGTDQERPWYQIEYRGTTLVSNWTRDALVSAESVFISLLAAKDDSVLMTIPDGFFTLISFSAAWLVISNFSMHELYKSHLGGSCDTLLALAAQRLSHLAPCPDHRAARCGHFIQSLLGAWGRLTSRMPSSRKPMAGIPIQPLTVPFISPSHQPPGSQSFNPNDWNTLSYNSDTSSENEFWSTLMANLSSGVIGASLP